MSDQQLICLTLILLLLKLYYFFRYSTANTNDPVLEKYKGLLPGDTLKGYRIEKARIMLLHMCYLMT